MEKTAETDTPKKKWWRWGVNRWFVLVLIILGFIGAKYLSPVRPFVQLPAEHWMEHPLFTLPVIGDFYFTNTLFALLIVDVLVILLAFFFNRAVKKGNLVLKGIPGALEALLEALYNMTESTAGKWAKTIFPLDDHMDGVVAVVDSAAHGDCILDDLDVVAAVLLFAGLL